RERRRRLAPPRPLLPRGHAQRRGPRRAGVRPPMTACVLSLPGGGLTGALYQVGALAALEDGVIAGDGPRYPPLVGTSSGASWGRALAGGPPVLRLSRALLAPVDNFFPLERGPLLRMDLDEWRRAIKTGALAARQAFARVAARSDPSSATPT